MYKIKVKDANITTDKYMIVTDSVYGKEIRAILDNEKDLAHYSFANKYYKLDHLNPNTLSSSIKLYNQEGKNLTSSELDEVIEKHFPKETKIIKKSKTAFSQIGYRQLINLGIMDFWLVKQEKILANLPEETKQIMKEIEEKSKGYIDEIFPPPMQPKKFKKI
jgi:hypothetical protein